jgi:hypothetical protein
MADLIGLINDISTSVKFGWIAVAVWGTVQYVWYRRARVVPGTVEASSRHLSSGYQFPSVTRPPEIEPIETPEPDVLSTAAAVELNAFGDVGRVSEADVFAEFQETGTPRRRSTRRRRATASGGSNDASAFALDTPKAS